jgi:hypothetical protein
MRGWTYMLPAGRTMYSYHYVFSLNYVKGYINLFLAAESFFEKLMVYMKFTAFCGTRKFITARYSLVLSINFFST